MQDTRPLGEVERRNAVAPCSDLDPAGVDTDVDDIGRPVGGLSIALSGDAFADRETAAAAVVGLVLNRRMVVGFDPGVAPGPAAPIPSPRAVGIVERDFEFQHIRLPSGRPAARGHPPSDSQVMISSEVFWPSLEPGFFL